VDIVVGDGIGDTRDADTHNILQVCKKLRKNMVKIGHDFARRKRKPLFF